MELSIFCDINNLKIDYKMAKIISIPLAIIMLLPSFILPSEKPEADTDSRNTNYQYMRTKNQQLYFKSETADFCIIILLSRTPSDLLHIQL